MIIIYDTISVSGLPYGTHSVPSLGPIKMSLSSILPAWTALIMGLWKSGILFIAVSIIEINYKKLISINFFEI